MGRLRQRVVKTPPPSTAVHHQMVAGTGSFAATLSSLGTVATVDSSEAMYDLSNAAQSGFLFFQGWI